MKKITLLTPWIVLSALIIFVNYQSSFSQNLVINPSFEDISSCPQGPSQLGLANNWDDCNNNADTCSSPDLYGECNALPFPIPGMDPPVGVPANLLGNQEARTGQNYAGIITKEAMAMMDCNAIEIGIYREYIQGTLSSPLVAGQTYCVEFYVSLADKVKWGTDKFGVYFSNTFVQYDFCNDPHPLPVTPQLVYTGPPLMNTTEWVQLQWEYTATGGEQYIVIGNFWNNAETPLYDNNCAEMNPYAYYYIEDVSVVPGPCNEEPGELRVSLNTYPANCGLDGSAVMEVISSCSGNPQFNWSTGDTGLEVEDLPAGNYTVTVTDDAPCQDTIINFTIIDDGNIQVDITNAGDACTGPFSATANVTGANPADCDFEWSTTPTQTTQTATNLAEGDYTVTVTYGTCVETATTTIISGEIDVEITFTGDMCQGPLEATANVTGADPANCTFQWNTVPPQTTQTITITEPGTYTVVVDDGDCTGSDTQNIIFHDLVINLDYEPNLCAGENAYAVVTVIEGQPPYSYSWSTGASSNNININTSGDYSVTVTDGGGCEASEDFAVTIHPSLNLTADVYDISCYGLIDGAVATNTTGGTPPFTYNWNLPYSTDSIGGLPQGTYAVTVTDIHGCSAANNWYVNEPQPLVFSFGMPATICQGDTVPLSIATFGGTEPYTYHWGDDPFLNVDFREVSPDVTTTYTVFVSDANNCSAEEQSVTITVSPPLELNISTTDVNCYNACDGTATLSVIGGSLPLDYSWDANGNYIQNLCADDYSVTVTDNFGCSNSIDFSIAQPDTITIQTLSSPATCFGSPDGMAWLQAWGGTPIDTVNGNFVYNYQWSNGSQNDTIIDTGGVYTVTLTDDNGCVVTSTITIDQPDDIIVTPIGNRQICIGQSSTFSVAATGGNGFFNFEWEGSDGSIYYGDQITVSPDVTTSYTLHVTDGNGCEGGYQTATVNVYPNLEILDVSALEDTVCQGETVRVELDIAGGNGGPYTIHFQDDYVVTTPHIFTPQNSGYFTYTVSDLCGTPTQTDSVFIRVMPMPENSFFVDRTKACPPATFHFTEDSEDIGQNYLWDFGDGGYSVNKNPSHTYTETGRYDVSLTVWSEYGCENKQTILNMITLHPKPRAEFMASPEVMSILNAQVVFTNVTENGGIYFWDFDDGNVTMWTDQDPIHTFTAPGEYDVTLIARNIHECMDTVVKRIKVNDEFSFYAPTAFSPNNDGINDYFYVTGYGIDKYSFNLVIFDRWGNKVFETNVFDPNSPHKMSWDGTDQGSVLKGDILLPIGAYSWYCKFNDIWGNPKERSGVVNIIR
jgi:gliding motility-associated-like protein